MTDGNEPSSPTIVYEDRHLPLTGAVMRIETNHYGLTKREKFAAMANVDVDEYSQTYAEEVLGEPYPGLGDFKAHLRFWAKFKAYVKVLEADLLIEALNKQP